jgi:hypothetical protein
LITSSGVSPVDDDLADDVIEAVRRLHPAIVVVGTHARHGLATWVRSSVGETIARNLQVPVPVVPNRSRGFVDPHDGTIDLDRILVPAGRVEDAQLGAGAARWLAMLAGCACPVVRAPGAPDHGGGRPHGPRDRHRRAPGASGGCLAVTS